jgi:hypothetical protein
MRNADLIRSHGRESYVLPARARKERRFSIRTGDVVRDLKLVDHTPAVCSALKTREFLRENNLRIVEQTGPPSGKSTTVIYTYEFLDNAEPSTAGQDAWERLRGALKDVFAQLGGGEAYLRAERASFNEAGERREEAMERRGEARK